MKENKNKHKLVLLSNHQKEEIDLTEEEKEIKQRLLDIEDKIDSIEKVVASISKERSNNIYASEAFFTLLGGAALSAATEVIHEYFGIDNPPFTVEMIEEE